MRVFLVVLLASMLAAQTTLVTNDIVLKNHGGWGLAVNIGANKGDVIVLDVKCDHAVMGECLIAPRILDGPLFVKVLDVPQHQRYSVLSLNTGDQIITANYYWLGVDVHYHLHIVASESFR